MNCANHPGRAAVSYCRECGKAMCAECRRPALGSIYCAEHLPANAAPPPARPEPPKPSGPKGSYAGSHYTGSAPVSGYTPYPRSSPPPEPSPYTDPAPPLPTAHTPHPGLAFILGFIPGVGAIYNGQYAKGLIHAVIFGLLVSITASGRPVGPLSLAPFFGILIAVWVFYMAFEAWHTARMRRHGVPVEELSGFFENRQSHGRFPAGALVLIAIGFILLLNTTDIITMDQIGRYWPIGLIAAGLYMLYARLSPPPRDSRGDRHLEARK